MAAFFLTFFFLVVFVFSGADFFTAAFFFLDFDFFLVPVEVLLVFFFLRPPPALPKARAQLSEYCCVVPDRKIVISKIFLRLKKSMTAEYGIVRGHSIVMRFRCFLDSRPASDGGRVAIGFVPHPWISVKRLIIF